MEEYLINEPCKKDEKTKQKFTDALQLCLDLMNENNNIYRNNIEYSSNNILTRKSAIIGHEMYEYFKETMNELMIKEEIIKPHTRKIELKRVSVELERLNPDVIKNLTIKKNDTSFIDDQGKKVELQNGLAVREKTGQALISSDKYVTRRNKLRNQEKCVDKSVHVTDCNLIESNSSDISNENYKETNNNAALLFNEADRLSMIRSKRMYFSFEDKKKVIDLVRQNPKWSLKEIRKHSNCYVKDMQQLHRWEEFVEKGGNVHDDLKKVNNWVFKKCLLYQNKRKKLSNELIKKWGLEARNIILSEGTIQKRSSFVASGSWVEYFKKKYIKERNPRELHIVDKKTIDETMICHSNNFIIPHETKLKIINTIREHPDWSINMIREQCGYDRYLDRKSIELWKGQLKKGGTHFEKMKKINNWVYQKCIEHKKNNDELSLKNIIAYGRQASKVCFPDKKNRVPFTASEGWVYIFRKSFGIVGRSPNFIITNKLTNDKISSIIEAQSKELPVVQDESDEVSFESNDKKIQVTYDDKIRVIKLARENPTWKIAMLRQVSGVKALTGTSTLDLWKKQVKNGGNKRDKLYRLNQWLDNKVNEYKSNNKILTRKIIQGFLIEAKKSLKIQNLSNTRSNTWWMVFRRKHNLSENYCNEPI